MCYSSYPFPLLMGSTWIEFRFLPDFVAPCPQRPNLLKSTINESRRSSATSSAVHTDSPMNRPRVPPMSASSFSGWNHTQWTLVFKCGQYADSKNIQVTARQRKIRDLFLWAASLIYSQLCHCYKQYLVILRHVITQINNTISHTAKTSNTYIHLYIILYSQNWNSYIVITQGNNGMFLLTIVWYSEWSLVQ